MSIYYGVIVDIHSRGNAVIMRVNNRQKQYVLIRPSTLPKDMGPELSLLDRPVKAHAVRRPDGQLIATTVEFTDEVISSGAFVGGVDDNIQDFHL